MKAVTVCILFLSLSACADIFPGAMKQGSEKRPQTRPVDLNVPAAPVPSSNARTVDQFDTTTAQDRAKVVAAANQQTAEQSLGVTIASLGDPSDPGFWLETPLVDKARAGRVLYDVTGKSAVVELRPMDGPKTAGSLLSLAAMRVLEAPLGGLPQIEVFGR
ncbi:hypothetical protein HRQ87_13855 [Sulfitobacter sp. 1151]|uniref:D-galactarate dehydratase n=1 Tax=Parasulfitobacter algicola TaxID=2614809 RepID=A0ABX2ISK0_9RHOB|nr:hypothetical protein [Sulfitobacter algicola]